MDRRRFLGITASVAGAGALGVTGTGCGGGGSSKDGPLRLVATEHGSADGSGGAERFWREVVEGFRGEHPDIDVEVSVIQWQDANIEVARMVEEGQAPDVAQISAFADFALAEELHRADEMLPIPQLADFIPSILRAGEVNYVQYGMPFASMTWRLYYNRTLFEEAGLDPGQPPRDWGELLRMASALRTSGVNVPFATPFGHDEAYAEAELWMLCGGGGVTDRGGRYALDSQPNVEAFTWLRDELVATGLNGGSQPAAVSRERAYEDFAAGTVGMVLGDPLLTRQAGEANIDYGTATPPGRVEPVPSTLGEASWVLAFNQNGRGEQIGTFLRYVFGSESVPSFAEDYDMLPVTTDATLRITESGDPAHLVPFLEDLPSATFHPVGKASWSRVAALIGQEIGSALQHDSDVSAVLGELQSQAVSADEQAGV
ncbi:extracellular solute-binding protein [Streptomyces sp. 4N509B]|uniref:extracellular solute-binding protein n=1 Tax=Streptomyces sp. 4N509B TaxID=3457413 RepID=UPI003FD081A8